jgi:hypothetical protein
VSAYFLFLSLFSLLSLCSISPSRRRRPHAHLAGERREKGGCRRCMAKALLLGSWDPPPAHELEPLPELSAGHLCFCSSSPLSPPLSLSLSRSSAELRAPPSSLLHRLDDDPCRRASEIELLCADHGDHEQGRWGEHGMGGPCGFGGSPRCSAHLQAGWRAWHLRSSAGAPPCRVSTDLVGDLVIWFGIWSCCSSYLAISARFSAVVVLLVLGGGGSLVPCGGGGLVLCDLGAEAQRCGTRRRQSGARRPCC